MRRAKPLRIHKESLGETVSEVEMSDRLVGSPAMIVNSDKMMTAQMRKMMKAMQQDGGMMGAEPPAKLQVNPRHPLVKNLADLRESDADLAKLISHQIFDNACMAAGLLEDPTRMLQRNYELLEKLSSR